MRTAMVRSLWALVVLTVSACAVLRPEIDDPRIELVSIKPLPTQSFEQRFEIGLKILNPNNRELAINGIAFDLRVDGFNLVSGVAADLPAVPAYGEQYASVEAGTNLINGLRFIEQFLSKPKNVISYELEATLDISGLLVPKVRVSYDGELALDRRQF